MITRTIQDVLHVMNDMVSLELALADLYQACGEQFPEDRSFWTAIQHQEELHAKLIRELADLISAHPEQFHFGRPFNSVAIKTTLTSVRNYTDSVRKGLLDKKRALFMARDIENSVLEAKYGEVVSTENMDYSKIIQLIHNDTLAHKNIFAAKVARTRV